MTNTTLAQSYLLKATKRLKVLELLQREEAYSDVVREAQELVEFQDHLPPEVAAQVSTLARISKWLRKEREFSFYGDVDFIPTEEYTVHDATRAIRDAAFVVEMARRVIPAREGS
jgi:hypothetical protein